MMSFRLAVPKVSPCVNIGNCRRRNGPLGDPAQATDILCLNSSSFWTANVAKEYSRAFGHRRNLLVDVNHRLCQLRQSAINAFHEYLIAFHINIWLRSMNLFMLSLFSSMWIIVLVNCVNVPSIRSMNTWLRSMILSSVLCTSALIGATTTVAIKVSAREKMGDVQEKTDHWSEVSNNEAVLYLKGRHCKLATSRPPHA